MAPSAKRAKASNHMKSQQANLIDQILEGARDQLRRGQVQDAVALLENAVELVKENSDSVAEKTRTLLRDVGLLVAAGTRFWAEWARLLSPDCVQYTGKGDFVVPPATGATRVAVRG